MKTEYAPFDASSHLDNEEVIAEYLTAAAEDEDQNVLLAALANVAKARGMARVAEAAGLGRESLYKTLAFGSHPRFETIRAILRALNVEIALRAPLTNKSGEARELSMANLPKKGGRPKAGARKATSQLATEIDEGVKTDNPRVERAVREALELGTLGREEPVNPEPSANSVKSAKRAVSLKARNRELHQAAKPAANKRRA